MKIQLDNAKKILIRQVPVKKLLALGQVIWKAVASIVEAFQARVLSDGGTYEVNDTFETTAIDVDLDHLLYPNGYKEGKLYSVLPEDGSLDYTVDRASTATRINKEGLIEVVPTNTPRIDYSTGVPVVLVEEQTTNLEVYSIFSTIGYAGYGGGETTLIENATIAPDGSNTATRLDGGASLGRTSNMSRIITVKKNTNYTYSYYIKDISLSGFYTAIYLKDTATGVADSISIPTTFNTDISKTDWTRITYTFNTDNNDQIYLIQPTRALNTGESIYVWGYQLEEGSKATSLIPTAGSTVTRLADTITNTNYLPQLTDRNTKYIETPTEKKLVINSDGDLVESTKYLSANQGVMAQADIDALAVDRVQYGVNDNIYSELKSAQDNNASLAMIAGKGEAGKLQSILPVPVTPYLGAELITNGTFDTDLSGWVVTGAPVVESGRLKLDQSVESQKLYQAILKVGKTYEISLDYETDGLYRFEGLGIVILDGIGSYSNKLVADSTILNIRNHTSTSYGYFDNVSVRELKDDNGDFTVDRNSTATYVAKDGLIKTASANEPRFDFSDGKPALLVEPQATNLLTYSEDFSQWDKVTLTTLLENNSYKLSAIAGTNFCFIDKAFVKNSGAHTYTAYLKKGSVDKASIMITEGGNHGAQFDLTNGTVIEVTDSARGFEAYIEPSGDWFKCTLKYTGTNTMGTPNRIGIKDGAYRSITLDGSEYIYVKRAQLETGSVATSYIPTAGSTVTRLRDYYYKTGIANLLGSTEGYWFIDTKNDKGVDTQRLTLSKESTGIKDSFVFEGSYSNYSFSYIKDGAKPFGSKIIDVSTRKKICITYKNGLATLAVNGVIEETIVITLPLFNEGVLDRITSGYGGVSYNYVGDIYGMSFGKTFLSDQQLIDLTTI